MNYKDIKRIYNYFIFILFSFMIVFNSRIEEKIENNEIITDNMEDFDIDDLKEYIYSSDSLTTEEKDYLFNEVFLNDALECVNGSDYMKKLYAKFFDDISINSFSDDTNRLGYYNDGSPSTIFIRDYDSLDKKNKDTVAHEYVHLCQDSTGYNLIIEACAEIISHEYFEGATSMSYSEQVKLVKKLMEIIGAEPVWYYNFTGDFSKIEARVKPYLSDWEYEYFIRDLTFSYTNDSYNEVIFKSLHSILATLYKEIYDDDIENDIIISLIDRNDRTLVRNYFYNTDTSFYYDYNNGRYENMSYGDAIGRGLICIISTYREKIDKDTAFDMIDKGYVCLHRDIISDSTNFSLISRADSFGKTYVTCYVDGVRYTDYDLDNLVLKGLVDVDYYYVENKVLNAADYKNNKYREGSSINIMRSSDVTLNDDDVYGYVPKTVYLPSIDSRYCIEELQAKKKLKKY